MANTPTCPGRLPVMHNNIIFKVDCALNPGHTGQHRTVSGVGWADGVITEAQMAMDRNRNAAIASRPQRQAERRRQK